MEKSQYGDHEKNSECGFYNIWNNSQKNWVPVQFSGFINIRFELSKEVNHGRQKLSQVNVQNQKSYRKSSNPLHTIIILNMCNISKARHE